MNTFILLGGSVESPGAEVTPGVLRAVLPFVGAPEGANLPRAKDKRRSVLAAWIAAGVLGVAAGLWFAVRATMAWIEAPSPGEPPALSAQPAPTVAALPSEPIPVPKPAAEPTKLPPAGDSDASAPVLAFKPSLRVTARSETPVSSAAPLDAAKIPNPQLISENWLHSKEP